MDNVISIFTGQTPCDNLFLPDEDFVKMLKNNSEWGVHIWNCQDCLKRYLNANRETLAEMIADSGDLE